MDTEHLFLLVTATAIGAYWSGRWEAYQYYLQRNLNHFLLAMIRSAVALLVMRFVNLQAQLDFPNTCLAFAMMAGTFGPVHRLTLNLTRQYKYPSRNKTIRWWHLSMKDYDLIVVWIPNLKTRFITLSLTELLVSAAMWNQLIVT